MAEILQSELLELYDYRSGQSNIQIALEKSFDTPQQLLPFMARYAAWNALFGSGVTSLAGKIGRCRGVFSSTEQKISAIADRSIYVASYFFDAARDEFDDRETLHRDTHRCLAQSTLQGMIDYFRAVGQLSGDDFAIDVLLTEPEWLKALNQRIAIGYGLASGELPAALFRSMGYHLGSELLADREFSLIDEFFNEQQAELKKFLRQYTVEIAGTSHNAYQWINLHSGYGSGVEADHFNWAVKGVNKGFQFTPPELHTMLRRQVHLGFVDFVQDHTEFFRWVCE